MPSATKRSGTRSARTPCAARRAAVAGPIATTVASGERDRASRPRSASAREQGVHAVDAGQHDQAVVADARRAPRRSRRRPRAAGDADDRAARPPRRPSARRRSDSSLAWARARVTTTVRPIRGRRSSQPIVAASDATGPTTTTAGEPEALLPHPLRRRSSRVATRLPLARGGAPLDDADGLVGRAPARDQRVGDAAEPAHAHQDHQRPRHAGEGGPVGLLRRLGGVLVAGDDRERGGHARGGSPGCRRRPARRSRW